MSGKAKQPGRGCYDLPPSTRGGVMSVEGDLNAASLPEPVPGPGAYLQTPTIRQEKEMRQLWKQVVRLVKNLFDLWPPPPPRPHQPEAASMRPGDPVPAGLLVKGLLAEAREEVGNYRV